MDDFVKNEAQRREDLHTNAGDYRSPVGNISGFSANLKGLRGEAAFGTLFNLPIRCLDVPGGDGGWEFKLQLTTRTGPRWFSVDVKTAAKPKWLICWDKKTKPETIYVLAAYLETQDVAILLGWQWGSVLMRSMPRMVGPRSCHWVDRGALRSMTELTDARVEEES